MFRKLLIAQILLLLMAAQVEAGRRVVAVRNILSQQSRAAIEGFESAVDVDLIWLNGLEFPSREDLDQRLRELAPEMVLAVGQGALTRVAHISKIPVAYLFALDNRLVREKRNFFGMTLNLDYGLYLAAVKKTLPSVRRIGFLYEATESGGTLSKIRTAARASGFSLVATAIDSPADIAPALMEMVGQVDAILMYPDISIFTRDTLAFLFLYSMENKIPVVSFSDKFLPLGAAVSVENNPHQSGREVGGLAGQVFSGQAIATRHLTGSAPVVNLNRRVVGILGIDARQNGALQAGDGGR